MVMIMKLMKNKEGEIMVIIIIFTTLVPVLCVCVCVCARSRARTCFVFPVLSAHTILEDYLMHTQLPYITFRVAFWMTFCSLCWCPSFHQFALCMVVCVFVWMQVSWCLCHVLNRGILVKQPTLWWQNTDLYCQSPPLNTIWSQFHHFMSSQSAFLRKTSVFLSIIIIIILFWLQKAAWRIY